MSESSEGLIPIDDSATTGRILHQPAQHSRIGRHILGVTDLVGDLHAEASWEIQRIPRSMQRARNATWSNDPPDIRIDVNDGTPYSVSQEQIDILQARERPRKHRLFLLGSEDAAYRIDRLNSYRTDFSEERRQAWERLISLEPYLELLQENYDICFKVFADLDRFFFDGTLANDVYLKVADLETPVSDSWARCRAPDTDGRRVSIVFNRQHQTRLSGERSSVGDLVGLCLHEMIHAYFLLVTGKYDPLDSNGGSHGAPFVRVASAICARLECEQFWVTIAGTDDEEYWDKWKMDAELGG